MKKIIVIIATLTAFIDGQAQTQQKKESIKLLFHLMKQDSLIDKTIDVMTASMSQMTARFKDSTVNTDTANSVDMNELSINMNRTMAKSMERTKEVMKKLMDEEMVDIYDKYFTQQEINDFIAFYRSKSGQKMIDRIPDIQKDAMTIISKKFTSEFQQSMVKEMEGMKKDQPKEN